MNQQDKIIYSAVFLTPESQQKLLEKFPALHEQVFAHHSTIAFRPKSFNLPLGEKYELVVTGYVHDEKGQTILVENKYSEKEYPHITISTIEGVTPVYSENLIKYAIENNSIVTVDNFSLPGIVGYFNGERDIIN